MIGITGGIASGKSLVAERLRSLGAMVLDADVLSKEVVEPLTKGWHGVKAAFPTVIKDDLSIDRRRLAQIIFSDEHKRKVLEEIIHPEVLKRIQVDGTKGESEGKVVFADVPLLYEVGWDDLMDQVWVVYVAPETQLKRLMERAKISREQALQMIASQRPLEEKVKKATKVINNNGSVKETWEQVDALWKELRSENSSDRP